MARKVNKKFLITLTSASLVAVGGLLGAYFYIHNYRHDPVRLANEGAKAAKQKHYNRAISYYQRALVSAAQRHLPTAPGLCVTLGDLYYKTTTKQPRRLTDAILRWRSALTLEPSYVPALHRLVRCYHKMAVENLGPFAWQQVKVLGLRLLKAEPKNPHLPHLMHMLALAYANEPGLQGPSRWKKGMHWCHSEEKIAPTKANIRYLDMRFHLMLINYQAAHQLMSVRKAKAMLAATTQKMLAFCIAHQADPTVLPYEALLYLHDGHLKKAAAVTAQAIKVSPKAPKPWLLAAELAMQQNKPAAVVTALHHAIALRPTHMQYYMQLADFQRRTGQPAEAIATLRAGLTHPAPGGGLAPAINQNWRQQTQFKLAGAYMALAAQKPEGSAQRRAAIAQASSQILRLRERLPKNPAVDVYQGKLRLLQGRVASAFHYLKRADGVLSSMKNQDLGIWIKNKLLLSDAYQVSGQSGSAIAQLDSILRHAPLPLALLQRAQLELQQHPHRAIADATAVLRSAPDNAVAENVKAQAFLELRDIPALRALIKQRAKLHDPGLAVFAARLDLAANKPAAAAAALAPIVKRMPGNPQVVLLRYAALKRLPHSQAAVRQLLSAAHAANPTEIRFILLTLLQKNPKMPLQQAYRAAAEKIEDPFHRYVDLAQFQQDAGNYAAAQKYLARAAKINSHSRSLFKQRFMVALQAKDWSLAHHLVGLARDRNMDDVGGRLYTGQLLLAQNHIASGTRQAEAALHRRPDLSAVQTLYGQAMLLNHKLGPAAKALQTAIDQKPDNLAAIRTMLKIDLMQNTPATVKQARQYLKQGLAYAPADPTFLRLNRHFNMLYGPANVAVASLSARLRKDPKNVPLMLQLAQTYLRNHQPRHALAVVQKAYALKPNDINVTTDLANLYANLHQTKTEIALLQKLTKSTNPLVRYQGYLFLGEYAQQTGQLKAALAAFRVAVRLRPKGQYDALNDLAKFDYLTGRFTNSATHYAELLRKRPHNHYVADRYARSLIFAGQYAQAKQVLQQYVLKKHPADAPALAILGLSLLRQQKPADASVVLHKALKSDPRNQQALLFHAQALASLPHPQMQAAISDLVRLESVAPTNFSGRSLLANLYLRNHQMAAAVHTYSRLVHDNPADATARLQYANLLLGLLPEYESLKNTRGNSLAATLRVMNPSKRLKDLIAASQKRFPNQLGWTLIKGRMEAAEGNVPSAVATFAGLYAKLPKNRVVATTYAGALLDAKRYSQVIKVATGIIHHSQHDTQMLAIRATARAALGHHNQAASDFARALRLSIASGQQYITVSHETVQALGPVGAYSALTQRVAGHPHAFALVPALAVAALDTHHPQAVITTAAPMVGKLHNPAVQLMLRDSLGMAYAMLGHYKQAHKNYQAALAINGRNIQALNNDAYLLAVHLHEPQAALKLATQAGKLVKLHQRELGHGPIDSNVMDTLGWVRYLTGDNAGAYTALRRSVRIAPLATAYFHLACVLKRQHHLQRAQRALLQSVRLARQTHDPILAKAQAMLKNMKG